MFYSKFTEEAELHLRMTMNDEDRRFWLQDDSVTEICGYYRMDEWLSKDGENQLDWLLNVDGKNYSLIGRQIDSREPMEMTYFVQGQGTTPYSLTYKDYEDIVTGRETLDFRYKLVSHGHSQVKIYSLYIGEKELRTSYKDN